MLDYDTMAVDAECGDGFHLWTRRLNLPPHCWDCNITQREALEKVFVEMFGLTYLVCVGPHPSGWEYRVTAAIHGDFVTFASGVIARGQKEFGQDLVPFLDMTPGAKEQLEHIAAGPPDWQDTCS